MSCSDAGRAVSRAPGPSRGPATPGRGVHLTRASLRVIRVAAAAARSRPALAPTSRRPTGELSGVWRSFVVLGDMINGH